MNDYSRIYVADLAAYNNGDLHGVWIDLSDDMDCIQEDIRVMLEESPVVGAEEYAIHDYEGFCGYSVGEFDAIEELREVAVFLSEFTEFGGVLLSFAGNLGEARRIAEEGYCGLYDCLAHYAQELTEECGDVPSHLAPYIDYQLMGRDMELNGDLIALEIGFEKVHIFRNI